METRTFIVYCSPAGSTKHVAGVIQQQLVSLRSDPFTLDLGRQRDWSSMIELFKKSRAGNLLFIGSPDLVWRIHVVNMASGAGGR